MTTRLIAEFAGTTAPDRSKAALLDRLTSRERDVLVGLARGRSNAEIAAALHVAPPTVKSHVAAILAKLELRDRVQVVIFAYDSGLARPGQ